MNTKLRVLALICFILPTTTVIISYLISVKLNLVTACIPNIEGCTSISRAGRYIPVKYFFKPMMFLYAIFLFLFWYNFIEKIKTIHVSEKKLLWLAFVDSSSRLVGRQSCGELGLIRLVFHVIVTGGPLHMLRRYVKLCRFWIAFEFCSPCHPKLC